MFFLSLFNPLVVVLTIVMNPLVVVRRSMMRVSAKNGSRHFFTLKNQRGRQNMRVQSLGKKCQALGPFFALVGKYRPTLDILFYFYLYLLFHIFFLFFEPTFASQEAWSEFSPLRGRVCFALTGTRFPPNFLSLLWFWWKFLPNNLS